MRRYFRNYRIYLRRAARGIPTALFDSFLWSGVGDALWELLRTTLAVAIILLMIATYPVSVFIVALIGCEHDRRDSARRQKWINEMGRP